LCYEDISTNRFGESSDKVFDDWDGVGQVTSIPDKAWHRNVDKIILAANKFGISTAIVCPPTIYGPGRGPGNISSVQWYRMARGVLQRGRGFHVGRGKNTWTMINVHDLSDIYLTITEEAMNGGEKATWNDQGYYFCENGSYVWEDIAKKIAVEAFKQGLIKTADVDSISANEANEIAPGGAMQWGLNSRCKAIRAGKLFNWEAKAASPEEIMPELVSSEAEKLGLLKTHAAKAGGA
jgi:nucleoside-diphosphate-sugar epimerase